MDKKKYKTMSFKIAIRCCSHIFGEGIKKLIEEESFEIDSVDVCPDLAAISNLKPNLVIADFNTVCKLLCEKPVMDNVKFFILGMGCLPKIENQHLFNFISKGLVGILSPMSGSSQLKEAIEKVLSGGVWFDHYKLQDVLVGENNGSTKENNTLTKRETEIAKFICRGFSNKEIMKELNISEQSVKSHLNKIYKKTGTYDRLQLALLVLRKTHDITHSIEDCFGYCEIFDPFTS